MTGKSDPRKVPAWLPGDLIDEVKAEVHRQDRSLSWLFQRAWLLAKDELRKRPTPHKEIK